MDEAAEFYRLAWEGDVEAVSEMLAAEPALIGIRDRFLGATPLHAAAFHGGLGVAELLLRYGADPAAKTRGGVTPLHSAAWDGDIEMAELLLDWGADIDARRSSGVSPLHQSVEKEREAMVKLLLSRGASTNTTDEEGNTPLHWAARQGNPVIITLLLNAGADPNQASTAGQLPLDVAYKSRAFDLLTAATPSAAIMAAVEGGDVAKVRQLLQADPGLVLVRSVDPEEGLLRICPNMATGESGATLLQCAVMMDHADVIAALLDAGATVGERDPDGWTLLHCAALFNRAHAAGTLIDRGADMGAVNASGWTPLHLAADEGSAAVARLLIARGAGLNARSTGAPGSPESDDWFVAGLTPLALVERREAAVAAEVQGTPHPSDEALDSRARRAEVARVLREHGGHT